MTDFHTHILPEIDDGSSGLDESVDMLHSLFEQGVTKVVATPHFYANFSSPDRFLKKRNESWGRLREVLDGDMPKVTLGAEVHYYEGISHSEQLRDFCIGNTRLLLLEMPVTPWNDRMIESVLDLGARNNIKVILAHIERYFPIQDKEIWKYFRQNGVLLQLSAELFEKRRDRKLALKLISSGIVTMLGSDCHNMEMRPPNMSVATHRIEKELGSSFLEKFNAKGDALIGE